MAKAVYIDSQGNEHEISGNNEYASMLPVSVSDSMSIADKNEYYYAQGMAALSLVDNTLTTALGNKIGFDLTALYTNSTYVATGGHLDLSEKPSKFRFLLIRFQTNMECCTQLVMSNENKSISQTIMANSTTGQVTYPLSYNATLQAQIDDTNQRINIIADFYNNVNYQLRITNVWGVSRK